jgi:hypothetical protein
MIKTTPFVNPFRKLATKVGDDAKFISHKGKVYEQVVRKKCQPKI